MFVEDAEGDLIDNMEQYDGLAPMEDIRMEPTPGPSTTSLQTSGHLPRPHSSTPQSSAPPPPSSAPPPPLSTPAPSPPSSTPPPPTPAPPLSSTPPPPPPPPPSFSTPPPLSPTPPPPPPPATDDRSPAAKDRSAPSEGPPTIDASEKEGGEEEGSTGGDNNGRNHPALRSMSVKKSKHIDLLMIFRTSRALRQYGEGRRTVVNTKCFDIFFKLYPLACKNIMV